MTIAIGVVKVVRAFYIFLKIALHPDRYGWILLILSIIIFFFLIHLINRLSKRFGRKGISKR